MNTEDMVLALDSAVCKILDRLTALEAAHNKAVTRAELAYDVIAATGPALEAAYKRIERLERTFLAHFDQRHGSPGWSPANSETLERILGEQIAAIRRDLAEIDRKESSR